MAEPERSAQSPRDPAPRAAVPDELVLVLVNAYLAGLDSPEPGR